MNAYKIALLAMYVVSALVMVSTIGKPRKPLTPGTAAVSLVVTGIMSALVVLS